MSLERVRAGAMGAMLVAALVVGCSGESPVIADHRAAERRIALAGVGFAGPSGVFTVDEWVAEYRTRYPDGFVCDPDAHPWADRETERIVDFVAFCPEEDPDALTAAIATALGVAPADIAWVVDGAYLAASVVP